MTDFVDATEAETTMPEPSVDRETRYDLITEARLLWESFANFRTRRVRSRNYYRGKPNESFVNPDTGATVYEDDYIAEQGRIPFKMNQIGTIIRNLKGQYRANKTQRVAFPRNRDDSYSGDMMSEALRHACDINRTEEIDADVLEESFIGGIYGWKSGYKWNSDLNRDEISVDPIDPMRFFFNTDVLDKRMKELRICGEIHDVPLDDIVASFARTKIEAEWLRDKYAHLTTQIMIDPVTGFSVYDNLDFFTPSNINLARVVEVWRKEYKWRRFVRDRVTGAIEESDITDEEIGELDMRRTLEAMVMGMTPPPKIEVSERYEGVWMCYYLTPYGDVLYEGRTPYWHETHPYTIGMANFVDGEIWGLIEDVIDPQRLVNRITTAIDYMFGAAAKGILMVPENTIPEGMTLADMATEWAKFNGAMKYKSVPSGEKPHQVTHNPIPPGMFDWLVTNQQMMKDVSGVQGASLGMEANSGTPSSLYHQQILQGQTTNRDYFETFFEMRRQRDLKTCKLIAQYYDEPMYLATAGKRIDGSKFVTYNPARVRDLEFDIIISDTADTPATRQLVEEYLTQLLAQNRLTFAQYLQLSTHPKAEMISKVIESTNPILQQQKQAGQGQQQIAPQQQGQAMPQGDPQQGMPGQMPQQQADPQQQMMMQLQQAAQNGDRDAMANLEQAQ